VSPLVPPMRNQLVDPKAAQQPKPSRERP
jgi:hypothetical protein